MSTGDVGGESISTGDVGGESISTDKREIERERERTYARKQEPRIPAGK